ncbi:MAG: nuclear transport factor 2 family protein [Pyrinomonadaceae bacterium]|nr:nuclear transport factor 2 family protein [Pyrinomonadaceae bacterium]
MNKFAYLILVFAALAINVTAQKKPAASADPSKDVRQAFDRLIEGIKQVDAGKVADTYEKSDRLLVFNNNGSATIGWENVKANAESSYAKVSNVSIEVTGVRVEMLGKTGAYVSCKWKQTQENDGKLESASGRMTLVFKLIGKQWKIVHRHTSPDNPGPTRPVFPSERTDQ